MLRKFKALGRTDLEVERSTVAGGKHFGQTIASRNLDCGVHVLAESRAEQPFVAVDANLVASQKRVFARFANQTRLGCAKLLIVAHFLEQFERLVDGPQFVDVLLAELRANKVAHEREHAFSTGRLGQCSDYGFQCGCQSSGFRREFLCATKKKQLNNSDN